MSNCLEIRLYEHAEQKAALSKYAQALKRNASDPQPEIGSSLNSAIQQRRVALIDEERIGDAASIEIGSS